MSDEFLVSSDRKGRYYYRTSEPSKKFRSVSTVIHWGEPKGKSNDSSKIGTIAHYMILRNLTDDNIDVPTEMPYWSNREDVDGRIEDAIIMWQQLEMEKVVEKWIAIEKAIWFEGVIDGVPVFYAGRIDGLAEFVDAKIRLVDIKTGDEYSEYIKQMGGYVQAIEFCMHIYIDEVWINYLDVGGNWIQATGQYVKRNVDRVPRVVVYNREQIEEGIKLFNIDLLNVFRNE